MHELIKLCLKNLHCKIATTTTKSKEKKKTFLLLLKFIVK